MESHLNSGLFSVGRLKTLKRNPFVKPKLPESLAEFIHPFLLRLMKSRDHTRLWTWPTGEALNIGAIGLGSDAEHIRHLLDAAETFHPGSRLTFFVDAPPDKFDPLQEAMRYSDLKSVQFQSIDTIRDFKSFDLLILLHPWPWGSPEDIVRIGPLRRAHAMTSARLKWILFRNLELWDGHWSSRIKRRILQGLTGALLHAQVRRDDDRLLKHVLPKLESASNWQGDIPCPHSHATRVFSFPRAIWFCPDCGMGFTPASELRPQEVMKADYGPGFARSYRYAGARERARYIAENVSRVNGYLKAMGFEEASILPENRKSLDYGCGSGRYAPLWLNRQWKYFGMDPSDANIRFARQEMPEGDFGVGEIGEGELEGGEWMKSRAPFGMIFLSHVIEHIPDPVALLRSLREYAAPGGWIYLECPNAERYTWNTQHRGWRNPYHVSDFTPATLRAVALRAGWSDPRQFTDPDGERFPHHALLARNTSNGD